MRNKKFSLLLFCERTSFTALVQHLIWSVSVTQVYSAIQKCSCCGI